jgi:hypothetical protein
MTALGRHVLYLDEGVWDAATVNSFVVCSSVFPVLYGTPISAFKAAVDSVFASSGHSVEAVVSAALSEAEL